MEQRNRLQLARYVAGHLLGFPAAAPVRSRKRWPGIHTLLLMCPLIAGNARSSHAESAAEFIPAYPLHQEIARLEQQGVLLKLDRGADIRGPDANDNGVRDDIEAYIVLLPITGAQNKAAMQTARVQQRSLLIDLNDKAAVVALGDASMAATACIGERFEPDHHQSYVISERIEAITANTPERARRYMQYMAALSGTSTAYPEGNACEE